VQWSNEIQSTIWLHPFAEGYTSIWTGITSTSTTKNLKETRQEFRNVKEKNGTMEQKRGPLREEGIEYCWCKTMTRRTQMGLDENEMQRNLILRKTRKEQTISCTKSSEKAVSEKLGKRMLWASPLLLTSERLPFGRRLQSLLFLPPFLFPGSPTPSENKPRNSEGEIRSFKNPPNPPCDPPSKPKFWAKIFG
jgi:hypothetical protein